MAGDTLLDAVKQALVSVEDCCAAVDDGEYTADTREEMFRFLDEVEANLKVVSGMAVPS